MDKVYKATCDVAQRTMTIVAESDEAAVEQFKANVHEMLSGLPWKLERQDWTEVAIPA